MIFDINDKSSQLFRYFEKNIGEISRDTKGSIHKNLVNG